VIQDALPSYDQSVISFAIYQTFSLVPFVIGMAFQMLNFKLITMDVQDEIMFYLGQKRRGMKII
jgi:hypothetical protein